MNFDTEELDNLRRLLSSPDASNVKLALEIFFQNPDTLSELLVPLLLFANFGDLDDYSLTNRQKKAVKTLLRAQLSLEKLQSYEAELKVLSFVNQGDYPDATVFLDALADYEAAQQLYEPYILQNSVYAWLYGSLAKYLRRDYPDPDKSYAYYCKAVEALPDDMQLKLSFADFLVNEGFVNDRYLQELSRVESILKEAISYYPSYSYQFHHLLGVMSDVYRKDKEKAKEYYYKALQIKPDNASSMNNLANILFKFDQNLEASRRMSTTAVKIDGQNIHYLDTLAWIEFKGYNNLEGALELFMRIRNLDKKNEHHASLTGLGEVLEAKGQYEEALHWYKKGLKRKPESVYKLRKIADLLHLKMELPARAKPFYKKILELSPDAADHTALKELLNQLKK